MEPIDRLAAVIEGLSTLVIPGRDVQLSFTGDAALLSAACARWAPMETRMRTIDGGLSQLQAVIVVDRVTLHLFAYRDRGAA